MRIVHIPYLFAEGAIHRFASDLWVVPGVALTCVALLMAAGIVLWLIGRRFARASLILTGASVGSLLGLLVIPILMPLASEVARSHGGANLVADADKLTDWNISDIGLIVGLAIGGLGAFFLHRSIKAVSLGVTMGLLLPVFLACVLHYSPQTAQRLQNMAFLAPSDEHAAHVVLVGSSGDEPGKWNLFQDKNGHDTKLADQQKEDIRAVQAAASAVRHDLSARWQEIPAEQHPILIFSSIVGLALGIILGFVMPSVSASACTSILGSGLWLGSFVWLSHTLNVPWKIHLSHSPATWAAIWCSAALLGMTVQILGVIKARRRAKLSPTP